MMRHSNLTFNGPFKRAELVLLPQYAASDNFLAAGKWTESKHHILSADCKDVDATVPLYCIVVGTISSSKTYLGKHGNFSTRFTDDAQKAKLQFTLTRECHGFANPYGLRSRVVTGTGTGWQFEPPENPYP